MDIEIQKGLVLGIIGLTICATSAWLHINGKDGSGWGLIALVFLVTSCVQITQ